MDFTGTSGDVFCEYIIRRKPDSKAAVVKIGAVVVGAAITAAILLLVPFLFPLLIVVWIAVYFAIRFQKVEYEYTFTSGDLDIDKLSGDMKRKNVMSVGLQTMEIMAPEGSHELDSYMRGNYNLYDYSANDDSVKNYYIFGTRDNEMIKIRFSPNDNMVEHIRRYAPRKVKTY